MKSKLKIFSLCALAALSLSACGVKKPVSVGGEQVSINNTLLEERYNFVPKDPYLKEQNYAYSMILTPNHNYLIDNDLVVKTFLLAHSSQKITLIGKEQQIQKYRDYFIENGVSAEIYLQPVEDLRAENESSHNLLSQKLNDSVQVLFFNKRS